MKPNLNKDQIQKLGLSLIGFVVLVYVYFSFFLGPLNKNRAKMLGEIEDVQRKIGSSKTEMTKATTLERQATAATGRFSALKGLSPEGAPIAWFPPRMKTFFASQGVERVTARLESSAAFKEAELSEWMKYNWVLDLPQTDFIGVGQAIASLENSEPLLSIAKLNIKALADTPEYQQVTLSATTTIVKR